MAVGTSNFPASLDTVVELIQAANNAQTTLNGALNASATTIAVISTTSFAATGSFAVDNELISYTGKTATSFTGCVRGYDGTTAATHNSGATVSDVVTTRHHEVVVDAILAIQERLAAGSVLPLAKGGTGVALTDPNADRILFWDDSEGAMAFLTAGSGLTITGTTIEATGAGSVTSVGLSLPAMFTVTNSPVTSTGTLTATLAAQNANRVLVGPVEAPAAAPTFRELEDEDIPNVLSIHKNKHLTTNGFVKTSGGDGTLSVDTATYLTTVGGSTGDYQINSSNALAAGVLSQSAGRLTSTATAVSSGVTPYLRLITPTDTGLTASTEAPGIVFGGDASGTTVTRTRAAGAVTTQREYIFTAPTYAAASATTITTAATLAITGAPIAGTNVTLTNTFGLYIATDSSATVASSLALQNANASGYSGISIRNNSGQTRSSIAYVPYASLGTPDYLQINFPLSGGGDTSQRAFSLGATFHANSSNQLYISNTGSTTRWDLTAKCTIQNDGPGQTSLTVVQLEDNNTVNTIQARARSGEIRYGLFIDTTETRSRLLDNNAGQQNRAMLSELVTLSTVGATTDTTIQIPANSLVLGVTVRVTTGITGIDSTALQFGDSTTAARFGSIAAFTAGTTGVGLNHLQGGISTDATGPIVTSATAVRLTLSGGTDNTPSAGAVRVTIHYISLTAPTS